MKNFFKSFVIIISALIVCMPIQTMVQASTFTSIHSKALATKSLKSTVTGTKLFSYLTSSANIISTYKGAVALHNGITKNNCVYFSSEAMRRINISVPLGTGNMQQYLDYLNRTYWSKTKDITKITPGSICFTTNADNGYPTHTFVFMGWVKVGDYTLAYVADNQSSYVHVRSMIATYGIDAFAFFMRK